MKVQTRYCASTAEHTHNKCRNMQMCIYIETYISSCNFPQNICLMFNVTSIKCGTEKTPTRRYRKMTRPLCLDKSAFPFFPSHSAFVIRYSFLLFLIRFLLFTRAVLTFLVLLFARVSSPLTFFSSPNPATCIRLVL